MAFVIAFFLIDLTMKLVDTTDDAYVDTVLITDKALIIKNIRENIERDLLDNDEINLVSCSSLNSCTITFGSGLVRKLSVSNNLVKYTDSSNNIIYSKNIDSSFSNISLTSSNRNDYYAFKISGENIFIDENYDMNIIVYNEIQ